MRVLGPLPLTVPPLEGVKVLFLNAICAVTAEDIATVLSPLGATLGFLRSAPAHLELGPQI